MTKYLWRLGICMATVAGAMITHVRSSNAATHHGMSVCWGCSGSEPYVYCDTLTGNGKGTNTCNTNYLPDGTYFCTQTGQSCANGMLLDEVQGDGSYQATATALARLSAGKVPTAYRDGAEALHECGGPIVGRQFTEDEGAKLRAASAEIEIAGR